MLVVVGTSNTYCICIQKSPFGQSEMRKFLPRSIGVDATVFRSYPPGEGKGRDVRDAFVTPSLPPRPPQSTPARGKFEWEERLTD